MDKKAYWEKEEQVIGILGLAPYATIDFLRKLADATPAKKDWEHIRLLIDMNTKIPSRGRALELGEEDPTPYMKKAIMDLHRNGADFVVIPCNTAHFFYDKVTEDLEIPVINIIKETSDYIVSKSPDIKKIGLMASRSTVKYKLYDRFLDPNGVSVLTLEDQQDTISGIIEDIKIGDNGNGIIQKTKMFAEKLIEKGAQGIIVGCTEISLVLKDGDISVPVFDSNAIIAQICVQKVLQSAVEN